MRAVPEPGLGAFCSLFKSSGKAALAWTEVRMRGSISWNEVGVAWRGLPRAAGRLPASPSLTCLLAPAHTPRKHT